VFTGSIIFQIRDFDFFKCHMKLFLIFFLFILEKFFFLYFFFTKCKNEKYIQKYKNKLQIYGLRKLHKNFSSTKRNILLIISISLLCI